MNRCYGKGWGGVGIMWKCGLWGWECVVKVHSFNHLSSDVMHMHGCVWEFEVWVLYKVVEFGGRGGGGGHL